MTTLLPNELVTTPNNAFQVVAVANVTTAGGTLVVNKAVGCSIVRTSTGAITVTLDDPMVDDDYVVNMSYNNGGGATLFYGSVAVQVIDTTTFKALSCNMSGGARDGSFLISVIGEKA